MTYDGGPGAPQGVGPRGGELRGEAGGLAVPVLLGGPRGAAVLLRGPRGAVARRGALEVGRGARHPAHHDHPRDSWLSETVNTLKFWKLFSPGFNRFIC